MTYTVAAFYRFTPLSDPAALRATLLAALAPLGLCGTLLLAPEGVNGTLAGSEAAITALLGLMEKHTGLPQADVKFSAASDKPFDRLKIRLKREIISFRQPAADPARLAGTYVEPRDWNALIGEPDTLLLDTRNRYETMIGSFEKARDPGLDSFTAFADYVRATLDPARDKKIAMFCTGGIRCEKASAFMRAEGFETVYHLKGGILKYLEQVPAADSKWRGECYVFDRRIAVGHGLCAGSYTMCFSCGYPLDAADANHPDYESGVSCARCRTTTGAADKARYRMRQEQIAARTGENS